MFAGENHFPCHNFTGPGTNFEARVARGDKPVNNIDNCSFLHDQAYVNIKKQGLTGKAAALAVQKADREAMACYAKYPDESGYHAARAGIGIKNITEENVSKILGKPVSFYGGKKKKRKPSAYNLFVKANMKKVSGTATEKMKKIASMWNKKK